MTRFDAQPMRRQLAPLQMEAKDIEAWLLAKDPTASGGWNELGKEEYVRSFTAAQTAGTDIADDLYFGIVDNISRGGTEEDFARLVTPILKQKGWLGGDDRAIAIRVALIYDTNLRLARASGRWSRYWETRAAFPYLRAIDVGDERVRHPPKSPASDHRAWGGIILPIEHPFWRKWWTPLGFRCRCGIIQMTRSQLARYKGGVTSEEELADRERRLGEPVFLAPAAGLIDRVGGMVEGANGRRFPGRPPIDPGATADAGARLWEQEQRDAIGREVAEALDRIGLRAPPPPLPAPPPPPKGFRSTVNPDVNAETIVVELRAKVQKRLDAETKEAAADPRYLDRREFSDRKPEDFGRTALPAKLENEAASALAAIKPELDGLADQLGIPRLRGFKSITGKAAANQGDGVMGINADWFNAWAGEVGKREGGALAAIERERAALAEKIKPTADRITAIRDRLKVIGMTGDAEWMALYDEQTALLDVYKKLRAQDEKLWKKGASHRAVEKQAQASAWKPGDDPKERPFNADGYFLGINKMRHTLFHEFGHHVHQYFGKTGHRSQVGKPPVETALAAPFRAAMASRKGDQLSTYATTNEFEWFAENFSAYTLGRRDLVDPLALDLIERLFNGLF